MGVAFPSWSEANSLSTLSLSISSSLSLPLSLSFFLSLSLALSLSLVGSAERNNKYVCAWCTRVHCLYVVKRNVLSVCMLLCAICFRSFDELVRPRRTCLRDKMRDAAAMHCSALLLQLSAGGISFYEGIVLFRNRNGPLHLRALATSLRISLVVAQAS